MEPKSSPLIDRPAMSDSAPTTPSASDGHRDEAEFGCVTTPPPDKAAIQFIAFPTSAHLPPRAARFLSRLDS